MTLSLYQLRQINEVVKRANNQLGVQRFRLCDLVTEADYQKYKKQFTDEGERIQ